ncbi:MxaK protein [Caldimonas sp. KR1-144]|uniref:MxaK protein n=1 Tax=Caldimonas sp. KR1-144 TaxID=3400911 RepID=UPI003BFAEE10
MRRRLAHALFAAALLAAIAPALWHAARWQRALAVSGAMAAASAEAPPADADARVQFAHAQALRRAGDADAALALYDGLAARQAGSELGEAALYNAGHTLMVQAQEAMARGDTTRALPLAELAKQRFRALLRERPEAWDARYNLERALQLVPEEDEPAGDAARGNVEKRQVRLGGMSAQDLP